MYSDNYQQNKAKLEQLVKSDPTLAIAAYVEAVDSLFEEKEYSLIVDLFSSNFIMPKERYYNFEVAYSLARQGKKSEAKSVYEALLEQSPDNPSILNNLSVICKEFREFDIAWAYIQKAYKIDPADEIVRQNFESLAETIQEREEKEALFQSAIEMLERENEFVIQKLSNFVSNARKDESFQDDVIPVPKWKFKVLMGTDDQKAQSLLNQWLKKGYLRKTGQRGQYNELVYEINPHIRGALTSLKSKKINPNWIDALSELDEPLLESLEYFDAKARISRIKKSIREKLDRDIDELYINYILKNSKSVVVLSGSVVELLLIYYLEKKKIRSLSYQKGARNVSKKLYDCDLSDLLNYCEDNNLLKNIVVHMGNISRLSRNYIHPGKELRDNESLDTVKANLCFSATLEILRVVT